MVLQIATVTCNVYLLFYVFLFGFSLSSLFFLLLFSFLFSLSPATHSLCSALPARCPLTIASKYPPWMLKVNALNSYIFSKRSEIWMRIEKCKISQSCFFVLDFCCELPVQIEDDPVHYLGKGWIGLWW